ncbi:VOC family protein [Sphingobium fuliginis]|jgi:catechol 2,3-dioxygenase-like lactoylglutathione lyase family enzyme|uniref:VOC family protein n=1 Tax=Sphingobium fuliginis (strain ATCC 27551) TaxID=336203 RepID=UPI0037C502E7
MNDTVSPAAAVHSVDYFALTVPDLQEAANFYEAFGLVPERNGDVLAVRCEGDPHVWIEIREGKRKKLEKVCFLAFPADLDRISAQLREAGALVDGSSTDAIVGRTPDGLLVEVRAGAKISPDEKAPFTQAPSYSATQASAPRSACTKVHPRRLAHLALFSGDVDKSIKFFNECLGVRLADRSASDVAFMYGAHGSDHHMVAFARSDGPGLHHCSWEVTSVDEVGLGGEQMMAAGYGRGWGVGRHVLGSNYFRYVRDPWGSHAEYSAGMDYIPAGFDWQAADHPSEDSFYQWGPPPPEDFVTNYETTPEPA